jgi:glycosyltransferase involved in cell wall biosynthesis
MLVVSLVTLGSPEQLTGGYLYHRRMAEMAADHAARIEFVAARWAHDPLAAVAADVVLVDSIAAAVAAPWAWRHGSPSNARRDRPPLAAILHQPPGGIDHGSVHRTAQAALDRFFYRRCRLLLAASDALADELVAAHGLPAERVEVVPPGADVAPVPAQLPELRRGRSVAFLSVGNWVARKGTLDLLEAFAGVDPELAILHLVGRDDVEPRYAARVGDRLRALDLADRVVYHGAVSREEVAAMYRAADVFVLPSLREPYGTVYGEALAAGLPVVGWRAGNLPYLAEDGREGVIVEPGDIAALSAALRRLAGDHEWRAQLSAAALERGRRLPTWDDTAAALFGALSGLVRSG